MGVNILNFVVKTTLLQKLRIILIFTFVKKSFSHTVRYEKVRFGRAMCRNTPKMYDLKSRDNHKICTQVAVPLLKGMHEL